jgi:YD repeat-containing protein
VKTENKTDRPFKYFAFISYSHHDEKFARWLQRKIETFRLPNKYRKQLSGFPKKIYPIFRDETDLLPAGLEEKLKAELDSSQYLILICSPHSAKSKYVNLEVEYFLQKRSAENIIPIIIDGHVGTSNDELNCFCPALPSGEQVKNAVNINPYGRYYALQIVLATLTRQNFQEFKSRCDIWNKKKRIALSTIISALIILTGISSYMAWDYYVPKIKSYSDYITEWGVPRGLDELSKAQTEHMYAHYEITTEKSLVRKLEYVNSMGMPVAYINDEWGDRPQIAYYYYRDDGLINYVEYQDNYGKVLLSQVYSTDLQYIDFQFDKNNSNASTLVSQLAGTGKKDTGPNTDSRFLANSDITRYSLSYDTNGHVTQVMYQRDNRGTASIDANGIAGIRYELADDGRIETEWFLNRNQEVMYDAVGIAGQWFVYSRCGMPAQVINLDKNGGKKNSQQGWSVRTRDFDFYGNIILTEFLDKMGNHTYYKNDQFAVSAIAKEYDKSGYLIRDSYFDVESKPMCCNGGYATMIYLYDEKGREIELRYLDQDDNPILTTSGYYKMQKIVSDDGLSFRDIYFGTNNQPVTQTEGFGQYAVTYSESGNLLTESWYDINGNPIIGNGQMHKLVYEYNKLDKLVKMSFYGVKNDPMLFMNVHMICFLYGDNGNVVEFSYYGINNEPVNNSLDGIHRAAFEYTKNGNLMEETAWDIDGSAITSTFTGAHKKVFRYDDSGNMIEVALFDTEGNPTVIPDSDVWKVVSTYDEYNLLRSTSNYGVDGKPVYTPRYGRWFRSENIRDEKGNYIQETYYDLDGSLGYCLDGYAIVKYEMSEEGTNVVKKSFFDINGEPVLCTDGYAASVREYDVYGNVTNLWYYGTDGELIVAKKQDFAHSIATYDFKGNRLSMEFYDANDKPMMTDDEYFKISMNTLPDGSKEYITELTESAYSEGKYGSYCLYDNTGKIQVRKLQDAERMVVYILEYQYDNLDRQIGYDCFDKDGNPTLLDGYQKYRVSYNEAGEEVDPIFLDIDGNEVTFGG